MHGNGRTAFSSVGGDALPRRHERWKRPMKVTAAKSAACAAKQSKKAVAPERDLTRSRGDASHLGTIMVMASSEERKSMGHGNGRGRGRGRSPGHHRRQRREGGSGGGETSRWNHCECTGSLRTPAADSCGRVGVATARFGY